MSKTNSPLVGILMGSDSDWPVMKAAADALAEFGIACEAKVISAHRDPHGLEEYVSGATNAGSRSSSAGAGGAAHLAGRHGGVHHAAGHRRADSRQSLRTGLDSLLSMVQMPPGVPVATVAINGARNAGILAAQILATGDPRVQEELKKFKVTAHRGIARERTRTLAQ